MALFLAIIFEATVLQIDNFVFSVKKNNGFLKQNIFLKS